LKRLFTRSKNVEEIELQRALRRCRKIRESESNQLIKLSRFNIGPTEEAWGNSAPGIQ
jgi:hypothetical protein